MRYLASAVFCRRFRQSLAGDPLWLKYTEKTGYMAVTYDVSWGLVNHNIYDFFELLVTLTFSHYLMFDVSFYFLYVF